MPLPWRRALCAPVQLATPPAYRQRELFNYRRYLNGRDCLSVDVFDQAVTGWDAGRGARAPGCLLGLLAPGSSARALPGRPGSSWVRPTCSAHRACSLVSCRWPSYRLPLGSHCSLGRCAEPSGLSACPSVSAAFCREHAVLLRNARRHTWDHLHCQQSR